MLHHGLSGFGLFRSLILSYIQRAIYYQYCEYVEYHNENFKHKKILFPVDIKTESLNTNPYGEMNCSKRTIRVQIGTEFLFLTPEY